MYHNIEENKKKELLKENIEELLENENKYKNYLYDCYIEPINVDKLLKYCNEFDGSEQKENIIKKIESHINVLKESSESVTINTEQAENMNIKNKEKINNTRRLMEELLSTSLKLEEQNV